MDPFCYLCFVLICHIVWSVPRNIVVTCWKSADILSLFYVMLSCVVFHFPIWSPGSGVVFDCIDS